MGPNDRRAIALVSRVVDRTRGSMAYAYAVVVRPHRCAPAGHVLPVGVDTSWSGDGVRDLSRRRCAARARRAEPRRLVGIRGQRPLAARCCGSRVGGIPVRDRTEASAAVSRSRLANGRSPRRAGDGAYRRGCGRDRAGGPRLAVRRRAGARGDRESHGSRAGIAGIGGRCARRRCPARRALGRPPASTTVRPYRC